MSTSITHLRVGQAWTAYVSPLIVTFFVVLLGIFMVVSGSVVSSAAETPDPAATIAQELPVAMTPATDKKASHRKGKAAAIHPVSDVSHPLSAEDRADVQAKSRGVLYAGFLVIALAALYMIYRTLLIRSRVLYTDDAGVWLYSGVLPWARGSRGVKWRDLEGALVYTGFKSWLLRSSTVRVSHRFTKASEIVVGHVPGGMGVVEHINAIHHELLSDPSGRLAIDSPR